MISLHYRSDAIQMTRAALLYTEYHLSHYGWKILSWAVGIGTLCLLPLYWHSHSLDAYAVIVHLLVIILVFGRYRLYRHGIQRNLQRHPIHEKDIHIVFDKDGLHYQGDSKALNDGFAAWDKIRMVLATANGYIFIVPKGHFVWVPYAALSSDAQEALQSLMQAHALKMEQHLQWRC